MINLIIPTLIVSTIAIVISLIAIVLVLAQRWSTHKIEWKPLVTKELEEEEKFKEEEEESSELLAKALDLSKKAKKKKSEDPLDEILEANNF
jgi:hypothetical protein